MSELALYGEIYRHGHRHYSDPQYCMYMYIYSIAISECDSKFNIHAEVKASESFPSVCTKYKCMP
jgi:hypothetical protein